jgi:hypothetical protein
VEVGGNVHIFDVAVTPEGVFQLARVYAVTKVPDEQRNPLAVGPGPVTPSAAATWRGPVAPSTARR